MATDLDEVVLSATATREKLKDVQIGVEKVAIAELAKTPSFLGENDIMKNIQTLPGVNAESEGASGFQVRGGTSAQNLVLLDNTMPDICSDSSRRSTTTYSRTPISTKT